MNSDKIISLLATITLMEMMVTIGLGVSIAEVRGVARDWKLVFRAALGNYVLAPAAVLGLLIIFRAQPMVSVGFLIAAVCPGAPYGPPFTSLARGNVAAAVGLMIILAGSSALVAPLALKLLLPIVAGGEPLQLNVLKMVGTLVVSQLLPLCIGLGIRELRPALAQKLKGPMSRVSLLLNLALLGLILAVQYRMLGDIRLVGYFGMLVLVAANFVIGWVLGGSRSADRKSLALTTSVRNVGLCLVIVTTSFAGTPAVAAVTAYGLFQTVLGALIALAWGRISLGDVHDGGIESIRGVRS